MAVFSIVFGVLIRVPSDGLPYPVFAYVALLPWTFFSTALIRASFSLVNDASLITKVYFPRLLLPASAVLVMTLDFGVAFVLLLAMVAWYGIVPGVALLILPRSPTRAASFRSGGERSRPQWSRSCLSGACSSSVGWRMHLRMWCD
jgi:lipopolysaccharide transport system permease protein